MSRLMTQRDLIATAEAARIMGCSKRTIHRLVTSGGLKAAQQLPGPNGAFLFDRRAVERLASQSRRTQAAA